LRAQVTQILGVHSGWWGPEPESRGSDSGTSDDECDDPDKDSIYVGVLSRHESATI